MPVTVIEAGPCHVLQIPHGRARRLRSRAARLSSTSPAVWPAAASTWSRRQARQQALEGDAPRPASSCSPRPTASRSGSSASSAAPAEGTRQSARSSTSTSSPKVDAVDVIGTTKGAAPGVMKRHNFNGQRATHGVKKVHRHIGGIDGRARSPAARSRASGWPASYGNDRSTMRNLKVVRSRCREQPAAGPRRRARARTAAT